MCGGFYYKFANMNLDLCRHVFKISDLMLRDSFGSANIICIFSVRQTSQNLAPAVYTPVLATIFQEILYSSSASFSVHTYDDKAVLFAFLLFKLRFWVLHRSLRSRPVELMYFIEEVLVRRSAWYTIGPSWHSPFKRQFSGRLQLHIFFSFSGLFLFNTV